jgi:hypothetical protein
MAVLGWGPIIDFEKQTIRPETPGGRPAFGNAVIGDDRLLIHSEGGGYELKRYLTADQVETVDVRWDVKSSDTLWGVSPLGRYVAGRGTASLLAQVSSAGKPMVMRRIRQIGDQPTGAPALKVRGDDDARVPLGRRVLGAERIVPPGLLPGSPPTAAGTGRWSPFSRSGLRIREALELRSKDLQLRAGANLPGHGAAVRVLAGKGGTSRTSGLDPGGAAVVARWLEVRACHGITGLSPVFSTLEGNRLTEAYVRRLLPRLARKAGVEKRVHAHGLRHMHAAQLREEGVDIGVISKQLGHRSIATTARYLDHIAPVAVVEAIGARSW